MPRLVTRAEFARLDGISAMTVTRYCRTRFADACIGSRLNLDHPTIAGYLADRAAISPRTAARPAPPPTPELESVAAPTAEPTAPQPPPPSPADLTPLPRPSSPVRVDGLDPTDRVDVEKYADWTLRQIADVFGTVTAFKDWLDARKKQVSIREKELKNWESEGLLISREAVRTHVFGHIEGVNRRLLQDVPITIVRRVYALARSDTPPEDAERLVREILGSELRPVKEKAARALRNE